MDNELLDGDGREGVRELHLVLNMERWEWKMKCGSRWR